MEYPITIGFDTANPEGLTDDAKEWLRRIKNEVKLTMPTKNMLHIEYPVDIVKEVRTVNIDDKIYRLDLTAPEDKYFMCKCIFPHIPWSNHEFMRNRWKHGIRTESKGLLTIEYPSI